MRPGDDASNIRRPRSPARRIQWRAVRSPAGDDLPRLVVLGCGFGGFSLLRRLPAGVYDVTLISPRNYFLFTPLLPSAVSGTVEFRSILEPARHRLRGRARLIEAEAVAADWSARRIACRAAVGGAAFELPFDLLVIAVGARTADYGVAGVHEHSLTLASVEDARRIRRAILEQFARAEVPGRGATEAARDLSFVICGGGPTGVEVAAEIRELLGGELTASFPELAPLATVRLLEAGERILSSFDAALSDYARRHFQREAIEVLTASPVVRVDSDAVILNDGRAIPYGLLVWAAGNTPTDVARGLGLPTAPDGRVKVDRRLLVEGGDAVYALGDCAACGEPPLPATAQVAQQQGEYLSRALVLRARRGEIPPFRFRPLGMLAYIGAGKALADLPRVKWKGRTAWLFWRSVYLTRLVSLANKVKVLFDWSKARLLGRDLSRF